mmetsp:Transcript_88811/g.287116  ORF Transcript_88811/g.287116 Transcript_88811/m.287116 type:complete len:220 (-) Transcript_88811:2879-3538(-)
MVNLSKSGSPRSRWNQTSFSLQAYNVPFKYIMNTSAKMSKNNKKTMSKTPSSFMELKIASTMFRRVSSRFTTRRGRKALRMRSVLRVEGPSPMKPITETETTMKSNQFHAQPLLQRYAPSPQSTGHATNFRTISAMKMHAKMVSMIRTVFMTRFSGLAKGKSIIMHTVESKMQSKMNVSKTLRFAFPNPGTLMSTVRFKKSLATTRSGNSGGIKNQDQP